MLQSLSTGITEPIGVGLEAAEDAARSGASLGAELLEILPAGGGDALLVHLAAGLDLAHTLGTGWSESGKVRLQTGDVLAALLARAELG
jgi:hypothetical protein